MSVDTVKRRSYTTKMFTNYRKEEQEEVRFYNTLRLLWNVQLFRFISCLIKQINQIMHESEA